MPHPPAPALTRAPAPPRLAPRLDGATVRGFARPTVLDGLRTLASVVGAPEALRLWSQAAAETGAHGQDLAPADHVRLVEQLVTLAPSPAGRAAAVSHLTRLRAHSVLRSAEGTT